MTSGRQKIPAQHYSFFCYFISPLHVRARETFWVVLLCYCCVLEVSAAEERETHYMMIRNPATHFIRSARFAFLHSSSASWALLFFVVFLASSSLLDFEREDCDDDHFVIIANPWKKINIKRAFNIFFFCWGVHQVVCVCYWVSDGRIFFLPKLGNKRRKMVMKRLRERPASSSLLHLATTSGCFMATTSRGDVKAPQPHVLCAVYIYSKS